MNRPPPTELTCLPLALVEKFNLGVNRDECRQLIDTYDLKNNGRFAYCNFIQSYVLLLKAKETSLMQRMKLQKATKMVRGSSRGKGWGWGSTGFLHFSQFRLHPIVSLHTNGGPIRAWRPQTGNQQPGSQVLKLAGWHMPAGTSVWRASGRVSAAHTATRSGGSRSVHWRGRWGGATAKGSACNLHITAGSLLNCLRRAGLAPGVGGQSQTLSLSCVNYTRDALSAVLFSFP